MKRTLFVFLFAFTVFCNASGQALKPTLIIRDEAQTHNMHIASDGKFFYTCNGGKDTQGKILKYTLDGQFVEKYPIKLDMRSILYNAKDKHLYVSTIDKKIFKILDLASGTTQLQAENYFTNGQCAIALSPNGKVLYTLDNGTLTLAKFKDGTKIKTLSGLNCGLEPKYGATAVAVDKDFIYTWDAAAKKIFIYDDKGKFVNSVLITNGTYGFSLSCANGMVFVSLDGKDRVGIWYGYIIPRK